MFVFERLKRCKRILKDIERDMLRNKEVEKVYEFDKYKNNKGQLQVDFNSLDDIERDIYRISKQNPHYVFCFDCDNNYIINIFEVSKNETSI